MTGNRFYCRFMAAYAVTASVFLIHAIYSVSRPVGHLDVVDELGYELTHKHFQSGNAARNNYQKHDYNWRVVIEQAKSKPRDSVYSPSLPKFLWGIPTVDNDKERARRIAIRETYLSYYKDDPDKENRDRICSLADIQKKRVPLGKCQLAYAFFMGGNPHGPTELLSPNQTFPMTVHPMAITDVEDDVVYLNIKENQFDGKMHTWFKYASLVTENIYFDYIAKVDSDTLLLTPAFFNHVANNLRPLPHNERVYAGLPFYKDSCNPNITDDHPCPLPLVGNVYMSGELSFMSPALASFITSPQCDRKAVTISHEDVSISNYVYSHPQDVTTVMIRKDQVLRNLKTKKRERLLRNVAYRFGLTADWHVKKNPFNDTLWVHSVSSSGGYFKDLDNFRATWEEYRDYWNPGRKSFFERHSPWFVPLLLLAAVLAFAVRFWPSARLGPSLGLVPRRRRTKVRRSPSRSPTRKVQNLTT
jgi:hypothetical protein